MNIGVLEVLLLEALKFRGMMKEMIDIFFFYIPHNLEYELLIINALFEKLNLDVIKWNTSM